MKKIIVFIFNSLKNWIQVAIKLVLVMAIVFGCYEYLNKVFYNREIKGGDDFRALPENSLDVVVLGSSHAQYSFVPSFFYYDSGLYSYVMGSSCQPYEVSYEMLKEVLKTQSPKLLVMEVFTAMPMSSMCEGESCYVRASNMMTGEERITTIGYLSEEKAEEYKNEFFNYHNDWKTSEDYSIILPSNVLKENKLDGDFGYVYQENEEGLPWNWWFVKKYKNDIDVELDKTDADSLNKIYELCKENGIEMLLYKTPIDSISQEDQSYLHKVWQWADDNNVNYIDFTEDCVDLNLFIQYHLDSYHAYVSGASIITEHIAEKIDEYGYSFEHEQNKELDSVYMQGGQFVSLAAVRSESDPFKYLDRMKNSNNYIVINYNPKSGKMSKRIYEKLLEFGLDENIFSRDRSYYAIIRNNEVLSESNDCAYIEGDDIIYSSFGSISYQWNGITERKNAALSIAYINPKSADYIVKDIDVYRDYDLNETNYNHQ